jgi:hypothetical protein
MILSKSNIASRIRPIAEFPPNSSAIMASRKTYQKLSSNGFDLAKLVPSGFSSAELPNFGSTTEFR